jgi:hypothetical protein
MSDSELLKEMKEYLSYDRDTGDFTWVKKIASKIHVGSVAGHAGHTTKGTYVLLRFNKILYRAHRIAWLFEYGEFPEGLIDHKDGNGLNNCIANLRIATHYQNMQNRRKSHKNSSSLMGVSEKKGKYQSSIMTNRKRLYIGFFDTPEEAHQAYLTKKRELHPFCTI